MKMRIRSSLLSPLSSGMSLALLSAVGVLYASPALAQAEAEAPAEEEAPPAEEPAAEEEPAAATEAASEEPAVAAAPAVVEEPAPAPAEAPAAEPSLSPLKVGTDTWSRFEYRENYDKLGVSRPRFTEGDQTVFRARLTFQTSELSLGEKLKGSVYFAPQASGSWGTSGLGGTIGEANLGIYEGYVKLHDDKLTAKLGRIALNYGDALIIGNLDWHQSGRAFDGLHLSYNLGKGSIDGFATQVSEGHPAQQSPFLAGDGYMWGVYGQFGGFLAEGMALDAYAIGRSWGAADTAVDDGMGGTIPVHKDAATFVTLGVRAKQAIGIFDYRVEADLQMGKQQAGGAGTDAVNKLAYQGDIEVGLTPIKPLRVSLGGAYASGDDTSTSKSEAYDELFPTTHKWLGLMDVIGFRTNIISGNLKVAAKLGESTSLNVDGHVFARASDGGLGRSGDSKFSGVEVDAGLVQKLGKFAYARGLYGIFLANKEHYGTSSAAHYLEIQSGLKF